LLEGIISLPTNTFYPKASVNASIIIVTAAPRRAFTQNQIVAMLDVGSTPSRKQEEFYGVEGVPWVRIEDMTSAVISNTAEKLTVEGIQAVNAKCIPANAVLVSTAGTIGKVAMAGVELTINQAVQALAVNTNIVLPKYVYYYLKFVRPQLELLSNHVTIPHLPKTSFKKFPIYYPSLDEQQVIVEKLDKLENLTNQKRNELDRLDDYLLSLFTNCFHDTLASAHQKQLNTVAELSSGIRARQSNTGEGSLLVNGFGNQSFSLHDTTSFVRITPPKNIDKYLLRQNDILIRRKLPSSSDPCAILVCDLAETALLGANLIRVRIVDDAILPSYLLAWLILSHRQGNLPIMSNYHTDIDISRAKSIQIPAVPVEKQTLFAHYFDQYLHIVNLVKKSAVLLDGLMQSTYEAMPLENELDNLQTTFLPFHRGAREDIKFQFNKNVRGDSIQMIPSNPETPYVKEKIRNLDRMFHLEDRWTWELEGYVSALVSGQIPK
jgi:type I restriction enzyme S subunit